MIYLDNSATSYPKPREVRGALERSLTDYGANPGRSGYRMCTRTTEMLYRCRRLLADFFGAPGPEAVVFQPGCTAALNTVLKGILRAGDHAVVSDLEHNAVMRPLEKLKAQGVSHTVVSVVPGDTPGTLAAFQGAIRPNTKLLVCTHGSNVFGFRLPVAELGALAHRQGLRLCVDAAQTAGILPINLAEMGIDYLCVAGHKGLYGMMGIGLMVLGAGAPLPDSLLEGGTGSRSRMPDQPAEAPERYESGTLNIPGVASLLGGLAFLRRRGMEALYRHEMALVQDFAQGLARMPHVEVYTLPHRAPGYLPVFSFNVKGMPSEEAGARLAERGFALRCGLHCAPNPHRKLGTLDTGTIRLSPSAFTQPHHIARLLTTLRSPTFRLPA